MTISSTFVILVSALFIFSVSGQDICLEVLSIADIVANKLKLDFVANGFDSLSQDISNSLKMANAINNVCFELSVTIPQAESSSPQSCSSIQSSLSDILQGYIYGGSGNDAGQKTLTSTLQQVLDLSADISSGNCLEEWTAQASVAIKTEAEVSIESEEETDQDESAGLGIERDSYLNQHVDDLVNTIELILQYSASDSVNNSGSSQTNESNSADGKPSEL